MKTEQRRPIYILSYNVFISNSACSILAYRLLLTARVVELFHRTTCLQVQLKDRLRNTADVFHNYVFGFIMCMTSNT